MKQAREGSAYENALFSPGRKSFRSICFKFYIKADDAILC